MVLSGHRIVRHAPSIFLKWAGVAFFNDAEEAPNSNYVLIFTNSKVNHTDLIHHQSIASVTYLIVYISCQ